MNQNVFIRSLRPPARSFFLFGPRATGKSTWLKKSFPQAFRLDLLDAEAAMELTREPHRLEALIAAGARGRHPWVILDEVQKIPALLAEVHRLMELGPWRFVLCGSSARKLKRGGADLLGGRALTLSMESFTAAELGERFNVAQAIQWGTLPLVSLSAREAPDLLRAYVQTYIREEIKEEGLVRNVPPFLRFLEIAGLLNGQIVNASNIASQAGVPRASVDHYFSILQDTLLGHFLPAYRPLAKVREGSHPKFYWFDPGVARGAAGLLSDPVDGFWKGRALETLIFHELRVHNETQKKFRPLAYYRTPAGVEIDFVIETRKRTTETPPDIVLIELKHASRWERSWHRALLDMAAQKSVRVRRALGIYLGDRSYRFGPVEILPLPRFLKELNDGKIF